MGISTSKIQTPEELQAVRNARVSYNDYLAKIEVNTKTDIRNNAITPETGVSIYAVIKTALKWLEKNPNANINELLANRDATTAEVQRLFTTDAPKRKFLNTLILLPALMTIYIQQKRITTEQENKFLPTVSREQSWYNNNQATATEIDFTQEMQKITDAVTTVFVDQNIINEFNRDINWAQTIQTSQLKSIISHIKVKEQAKIDQTVDLEGSRNLMFSTASQVFWGFLFTVLCLLSGSFAANAAIGRIPAYRVLYFIYGAIPYCMPIVLAYTIYRRIKDGRIPMYAMLPISIEPATTRLGRVLWFPFYWIPDQLAIDAYKAFTESLATQIA